MPRSSCQTMISWTRMRVRAMRGFPPHTLGVDSMCFARVGSICSVALRQDRPHDLAGDVGEPEVSPLVAVREPLVVDPEQVQDRGVEIVDVDQVLDGVVTQLV